jgi:hypothetical protein
MRAAQARRANSGGFTNHSAIPHRLSDLPEPAPTLRMSDARTIDHR